MLDNFYGTLTPENVHAVADLLRKHLGDKPYVFVTLNEGFSPASSIGLDARIERLEPEAATGGNAVIPTIAADGSYAFITVVDTYGVWTVSSNAYVSIDRFDGVHIKQTVGAGHTVYWKVLPVYRGRGLCNAHP
jgi:hypothetical protein